MSDFEYSRDNSDRCDTTILPPPDASDPADATWRPDGDEPGRTPTAPCCGGCGDSQCCSDPNAEFGDRVLKIAGDVAGLVMQKNEAYGDSFAVSGTVLYCLFPDGIPVEKLEDALAITRVVDKLFRIATRKDAFGESPWRDIAGYALLALERDERGA